jgi:hypothetical protein
MIGLFIVIEITLVIAGVHVGKESSDELVARFVALQQPSNVKMERDVAHAIKQATAQAYVDALGDRGNVQRFPRRPDRPDGR